MPTYSIKSPDGRTVELQGDSPPTEQELNEIFAKLPKPTAPSPSATQQPSMVSRGLNALPAVGGAVGGLIGGAGGTAFGLGFGGVPGAIGGAALGGSAGEAVSQLGHRIMGDKAPESSVGAAADIGKEGAIQGAAEAAGGAIGKGLSAVGERVMQSALKPTISVLKEYGTTAPKLVKTLLDEGVNVTSGGLQKLQRLLGATNAEIKEAVKNAPGMIERDTVAARALPVAQKMSEQVNPDRALRDVGKAVQEFTSKKVPAGDAMVSVPRGPLTVPEAQAMKIGTYQQIGKEYGKLSSASVETQKALARGLKEEIEAAIPKIKALNQHEAELMAASEAVGHRVSIAGNRDPVGFAWAAHAPQTFIAALIDRSPVIKSMLARGMYGSAAAAAKVSPQVIRAAVASIASDESDAEPEKK